MKTFQVCGLSNSGKTTVIKEMIKRLVQQNYKVASIKSVHSIDFQIDQPGKDTYVHARAGADPVVACGSTETDFLYQRQMGFLEIANKISADWLVVEGFNHFPLPKVVCGREEADLEKFIDRRTFAIAGIISQNLTDYHGIPVFNIQSPDQCEQLFSLIKQKTFPLLPYVKDDCCQLCGLTCSKLVDAIVQGEKSYDDCVIKQSKVQLKISDKAIPIVPFVQKILRNSLFGIVSELSGWEKNKKIEVVINP